MINGKKILTIATLVCVSIFILLKFNGGFSKSKLLPAKQSAAQEISGTWDFEIFGPPPSEQKALFRVVLKQDKNSLLGTFKPSIQTNPAVESFSKSVRGQIDNDSFNFVFFTENFPLLQFKGIVHPEGLYLKGDCKFNTGTGFADQPSRFWRATKVE